MSELPTPAQMLAEAVQSANNAVSVGGNMTTWLEHGRLALDIARELREGTLAPERPTDRAVSQAIEAYDTRTIDQDPGATAVITYDQSAHCEPAYTDATAQQPAPIPNGRGSIQALVRQDMLERERLGIKRYGTSVQAFNGRDALLDAYQEVLDLAFYLKQVLVERDASVDH